MPVLRKATEGMHTKDKDINYKAGILTEHGGPWLYHQHLERRGRSRAPLVTQKTTGQPGLHDIWFKRKNQPGKHRHPCEERLCYTIDRAGYSYIFRNIYANNLKKRHDLKEGKEVCMGELREEKEGVGPLYYIISQKIQEINFKKRSL